MCVQFFAKCGILKEINDGKPGVLLLRQGSGHAQALREYLCVQFFAKCGILKEDDDGKPRVKLYKDRATGMLKGDGLVYYLKQPSVSSFPSALNAIMHATC